MTMLFVLTGKIPAGKDDFGKELVDLTFRYCGLEMARENYWFSVRADMCADWNEGDQFEISAPRKTGVSSVLGGK